MLDVVREDLRWRGCKAERTIPAIDKADRQQPKLGMKSSTSVSKRVALRDILKSGPPRALQVGAFGANLVPQGTNFRGL